MPKCTDSPWSVCVAVVQTGLAVSSAAQQQHSEFLCGGTRRSTAGHEAVWWWLPTHYYVTSSKTGLSWSCDNSFDREAFKRANNVKQISIGGSCSQVCTLRKLDLLLGTPSIPVDIHHLFKHFPNPS
jgi:hypothetical protein